ncbi:endonuclease/exonuclease/phosphatase family protein [Sinomicrobium soli]|uniref:endonuclease/exonuclease/phosphatase family protein n=1 Tax=Sinomicrobium sp. N-1-3-6 TaxID=2219864 RepID=UPI000DCC095A|nr:endonuclease/exonuclease/phosphatase family protein [Sinomicrobium sp. N-1-3-6]RAV30443.1 endonuclease [Sinomicrobium sp. N-1-3-6]
MRKLGALHKVIFFLNTLFAVLLLLSYILPYVFPKSFPLISVLSLTLPVFIAVNVLFMLYWLVQFRRQFLLSLVILLIGYKHVEAMYRFSGVSEDKAQGHVKLMTYNVRIFNAYDWLPQKDIPERIKKLVEEESPDILCVQEFYYTQKDAFNSDYPYQFIKYTTANNRTGQAVFSKYPIVERGSLEFPETGNNALYVDVVKDRDTFRVYNLHLESLHIVPRKEHITVEDPEALYKRMGNAFALQHDQVEIFDRHRKTCRHRMIVAGDFNNTPYSYVYKRIRGDMKDSFVEKGSGFGRSYDFDYFPMRIDFILTDRDMKITAHKNYDERLSDHYPVMATIDIAGREQEDKELQEHKE